RGVCPNGRNTAEAVFRLGRLTASYIHFYLPPTRAVEPLARGVCPNGRNTAEAVFRLGRLTASYIHFYLPPTR
ncbi:hypothetical protein ACLXBB_37245, partial [Pseudomonas aeruginosa]